MKPYHLDLDREQSKARRTPEEKCSPGDAGPNFLFVRAGQMVQLNSDSAGQSRFGCVSLLMADPQAANYRQYLLSDLNLIWGKTLP